MSSLCGEEFNVLYAKRSKSKESLPKDQGREVRHPVS